MTTNSNQGQTTFLVIHGIGEQVPFESLDSFTRGLLKHLNPQNQPDRFQVAHQIIERQTENQSAWTESFVRISSTDEQAWSIDIHEYYWAYLTENLITVPQVWQWLEQTLAGTRHFYQNHETLDQELQDQCQLPSGNLLGSSSTTHSWYRLSRVIWHLRVLYPLIRLALFLTPQWPYWQPFQILRNWLERRATRVVVGYVGDLAIYTSMDQKSRYFQIRQQIIKGAQELLESILQDEQNDYVVVAGHSLGSVIAYDVLNRLNIKANLLKTQTPLESEAQSCFEEKLAKLQGLITFGSPLDKVAFFFQEQLGRVLHRRPEPETAEQWIETPYIRSQILGHLHSFKIEPQEKPKGSLLTSPIQPILADPLKPEMFKWINFYDCKDPISGHLHFYQGLENICLRMGKPWGYAHNGYWQNDEFYQKIATQFLFQAPPPTPPTPALSTPRMPEPPASGQTEMT